MVTPGSSHDKGTGRYVVPVLAAYTASPVVEITVPVPAAHAASGLLFENVVPIVGCSGNIAEEKEKKEESEEHKSLAKQVLVCDQDEPGEDVR